MTTPASPLLSLRHVTKRFGDHLAVDDVDLDVAEGEILCIIGPSGSGKSTLLRCINHIEPVTSGRVRLDGELIGNVERNGRLVERAPKDVARQRARMGMVFQRFELLAHRTAVENVAVPLRLVARQSKAAASARARELLAAVGMSEHADKYPSQLSGGQQQRVGIARALALDPRLLLLDEPTSALDPELVHEVLAVIRALATSGRTMLIVTHEIRFARDIADRIIFFDQGRIVETGAPAELLAEPREQRTRDFLSKVLA